VLYFLAQIFRAQLIKEITKNKKQLSTDVQYLANRAKTLIKDLASISLEIAQMAVARESDSELPDWFLVEIVRDLPKLAIKSK
jgi:hypothetical protein